jgi:hypothetical protein
LKGIILLPTIAQELGVPPGGATAFYVKFAVRVIFAVLIILYFFRRSVLDYFRLELPSKARTLAILAGASVVVVLLLEVLTEVL